MPADTPTLPSSLLDQSLSLSSTAERIRWYMCVIVTLSSLNYPDVIPQVYEHFSSNLLAKLPPDDRFAAVQKVREGLIKSTGIAGAGRTGNAMRTLSNCIPDEYREKDSPRSKESDEVARKRGREFWLNIYARNPAFDPEASVRASPDYAFIVRGKSIHLSHLSALNTGCGEDLTVPPRSPLRSGLLIRWRTGPLDHRLRNGLWSVRNGLPEPTPAPHEGNAFCGGHSTRPPRSSRVMSRCCYGTRGSVSTRTSTYSHNSYPKLGVSSLYDIEWVFYLCIGSLRLSSITFTCSVFINVLASQPCFDHYLLPLARPTQRILKDM